MADDSGSTYDENDPKFDYNGVKQKYLEQIDKIKSAAAIRALYPKERIESIVNIMKDGQMRIKNRLKRTSTQYRLAKRYKYVEHHGKTLLFLKKLLPTDPTPQVISIEDSFDVIMEVHLNTGHSGRDKMSKIIKNIYYIYKPCLQIMINACNVCRARKIKYETDLRENLKEQENKPQFNSTVYVDVLDMTTSSDGQFNYLLLYQDKQTNFILLRPIMQKETTEIACELFKIFTDYGEPEVIRTNDLVFLDCVIGEVKQLDSFENSSNLSIKEVFRQYYWLVAKINLWIEKTGSNNWPVGCFEIQFEMNTTRINKKDPYCAVFNRTPNLLESNVEKASEETVVNAKPVSSNNSESDLPNETSTVKQKDVGIETIAQHIPETKKEVPKKMPHLSKRNIKNTFKGKQFKTSLRERLLKQYNLPRKFTAPPKVLQLKDKSFESIGDMIDSAIKSSFENIANEKESDTNLPIENTNEKQDSTEKKCKVCNRKLATQQMRLCCDRCQQFIHEICGDWCVGLPGSKSVVVYLCMICKKKEDRIRKLKKKAESIEKMLQDQNNIDVKEECLDADEMVKS